MKSSIRLEGAHVVAAMTPPISKSPFNRGNLVLMAPSGTIIRVDGYAGDESAEGTVLSAEELQSLVEAGHVTELPTSSPIPAVSGGTLWVLRGNFPLRDRALEELALGDILVTPPIAGPEDAKLCVVTALRAAAVELLDRWRNRCMVESVDKAIRREWEDAARSALLALAVTDGLDHQVLAMLILAEHQCGRELRAVGFQLMARRSRGFEFEGAVVRARNEFERKIFGRSLADLFFDLTDPSQHKS